MLVMNLTCLRSSNGYIFLNLNCSVPCYPCGDKIHVSTYAVRTYKIQISSCKYYEADCGNFLAFIIVVTFITSSNNKLLLENVYY